ncbi:acyl carrier protein [Streptomyces thermolineatus]|uniref:Acyl carrier protein n=1 Tax=Streptomyces thermolineatus TaxID=44033 RepID=A0ABN3LT74_9ACTN|nr:MULTISPECIES: acyl carrier protein [unclassified Streptomyces]MCZ2523684.1 acyl carrier protein [Streptomyces sp. HB2AG]QMV22155.1 acyl carrier protein [Streptomyces sp. SCUT-3]
MTQAVNTDHLDELREIVAEVLEVEPEEITETSSFVEEHEADSLRAIEILARIEKKYGIDIPQSELPNMGNLRAVHDVVAQHAGWQA